MKKIINNPHTVAFEMCQGIALAHPEVEVNHRYKYISRKEKTIDKVTLISGGGSGHEPAHAGFVGVGMLDVAVCGEVFSSPSQVQVYKAIKSSLSKKGSLLIIKNYSGDMMNFLNAMEMVKEEGEEIEYIKVDDDIAVKDSLYTVGNRGVAGTLFVHKIVGAAAERRNTLSQLKTLGEKVIKNTKSLGFAFSSCTVPAKGTPTFILSETEMEYGVGIHGEPGISREKKQNSKELASRIAYQLLEALSISKDEKCEIAILVNGFGATPLQELYIIYKDVIEFINNYSVSVKYVLVGEYMTSLEMAGGSITFLKLDSELKKFLYEPCEAPSFKQGKLNEIEYKKSIDITSEVEKIMHEKIEYDFYINNNILTLSNMKSLIFEMAHYITLKEKAYCDLDSVAGDGDFGASIASGFREIIQEKNKLVQIDNFFDLFNEISLILMDKCGGASGPIWGAAFRGMAKICKSYESLTIKEVTTLLESSVKAIQKVGERAFGRGAIIGDKTLLDALIPCCESWQRLENHRTMIEGFILGAQAAKEGAESTKMMVARMGRAGTVGERSLGHPDAGAVALGEIFSHLAKLLANANRD